MTDEQCPNCDSKMSWTTKRHTVRFKDKSSVVDVETWWCDECPEAIFFWRKFETDKSNTKDVAND